MKQVTVELGSRGYDVLVGPGALVRTGGVLADHARAAVVSQTPVLDHWGSRVLAVLEEQGVDAEVFTVPDGEEAKSPSGVEDLCRRFAAWGLLRADAVVALGGGVVGDLAGFAAAVYHRGVDLVQAPTTLLGQVDAAIGGKTGVNLPEGKNLVGAFHQPLVVLADTDVLTTLPERTYRSGLGEVLKYACVLDEALRELLLERTDDVLARDLDTLVEVVERCAAIKADVVAADERELTGLRSRLNYGHTLGHALETLGGYELTHGEAVAVGVVFAAELARELGRIDDEAVAAHRKLVSALGLPTVVPQGLAERVSAGGLVEQMRRDKKTSGGLTFVLAGPDGLDRVEDPNDAAVTTSLAAVGIEASP